MPELDPSSLPPPIGEAEYLLETPLKCPLCKAEISTLQVVRLLRSRVNFVSTLPQRGHAIICSACQSILSVELD
jgi:hypothetical protein